MKVSVVMITYNHERFIAQAIESVLMQGTSFDYELVIGEDCSTDRTREILIDFQRRFPERIRLLLRDQNVGMHENFVQTLAACTGEYIALLDGDDYWTSPYKLQMQSDFLDSHLDCPICFHPFLVIHENNSKPNRIVPEKTADFFEVEDLIKEMFIQPASVMFRGKSLQYPEWIRLLRMGDWPLFILLGHQGRIGCLKETMGVYRIHSGGTWTTLHHITMNLEVIKMYNSVNAHFEFKYGQLIRPILAQCHSTVAVFYDQNGDSRLAKHHIRDSIKENLLAKKMPTLNQFKMFARLSCPSLYLPLKRLVKGN